LVGSATSLLIGGYILGMASDGAFSAWPLIGTLQPWQITLILTGLFGLPLSLMLLLAPEPERPPLQVGEVEQEEGMFAGLGTALRHMRVQIAIFIPLIMFVTFGAMSNFAKSSWVPALLGRTWNLAPQQVGPLMGGMVLTCGLSGLLFSGFALNWLTVRGGDIRNYGLIATLGAAIGMVGIGVAPSLNVALVMVGLSAFFLGTSYSVGATTLGEITPVRLMGRVTAIYFLFVSLIGQALGPFLVGFGSQKLFSGVRALANSFSLFNGLFGLAMLISVLLLRKRLRQAAASEQLAPQAN